MESRDFDTILGVTGRRAGNAVCGIDSILFFENPSRRDMDRLLDKVIRSGSIDMNQ